MGVLEGCVRNKLQTVLLAGAQMLRPLTRGGADVQLHLQVQAAGVRLLLLHLRQQPVCVLLQRDRKWR